MSFMRQGSIMPYFKRRLGQNVTASLLLLLGLWNGTNHPLFAQQCSNHSQSNSQSLLKLNPVKEAYLLGSINILKTASREGCINPQMSNHVTLEVGEMYRYRFMTGNSCITFPNGDSLFFLVHSGHEQESIGDLTLAIDQQGRLYLNEGHVCGGLIHFYSNEKGSLETVNNFILYMKSDTDDKSFSLLSEQLNHP